MATVMWDASVPIILTNAVESCESSQDINQIVNYAIDGTAYIQIVGSPKVSYDVICYVSRSKLPLAETAWHEGHSILIGIRNEEYRGIITEFRKSIMPGMCTEDVNQVPEEFFKLELKLAKITT